VAGYICISGDVLLLGETFGFPHLRALLAEHEDAERSLVDLLMKELFSFTRGGWEREDDITLMIVERSEQL
jgi:serine phosphatase RsbU (regulator of sigma subunit)